jgi:aryl-alcohol dehydrogenase-like predicted oxidoreductase
MEYRSLGRTGVQVSPLCLGCMNFGWGAEEDDSIRIVHRAMDAGINFLDTANVYARGVSETITGKALAADGRRDRVLLATKVHGRMADDDPNASGNHRRHIIRACEDSLRRLQTDRIDLYQIHRPQPMIPIDETLRALDDLIRAGKVLYIGSSTFAAWQVVESLWVSKELGLNRFLCEQPPYNILDRRIERELLPACRTYGIGVIPWSPIAGGLLSGKYRRGETGPAGSRYEKGAPDQRATEQAYVAIESFVAHAAAKGCTAGALALSWCASRPGVTSPIIGPRTMEQLEDSLTALEVAISPEDETVIDAIVPPGTNVSSYYEADFGPNARWD